MIRGRPAGKGDAMAMLEDTVTFGLGLMVTLGRSSSLRLVPQEKVGLLFSHAPPRFRGQRHVIEARPGLDWPAWLRVVKSSCRMASSLMHMAQKTCIAHSVLADLEITIQPKD
jgi:hypothetical protein